MTTLAFWVWIWSKNLRQKLYRWNTLGLFSVSLKQSAWMMACKRVNLSLQRLSPQSRMRMVNQWVGCSATEVLQGLSLYCKGITFQILPLLWIDVSGTCLVRNTLSNWHWRYCCVTWSRQRIVVWYWILIMMCVKWMNTQMPIFLECMDMRSLMILHVLIYVPALSSRLNISLFCGFQSYRPIMIYQLWSQK